MIKAVVVGINVYKNFPDQTLRGCINDAQDVMDYLTRTLRVPAAAIQSLFDGYATKRAIETALRDMLASSSPGDHLLFHFSGHGARRPATGIGEADGFDEILCPTDFSFGDRNSALSDKEIAEIIASVPAGTALTLTVDACHSGDISKLLSAGIDAAPRFIKPPLEIAKQLQGRKRIEHARSLAGGVTVSACASSETAADTSFDGRPSGAFTYCWIKALEATPSAPLNSLLADVSKQLVSYNMHPELQGAVELRGASFLCDPPPVSRTLAGSPLGETRAMQVVYEEQWGIPVFGRNVGVSLRAFLEDGGFVFSIVGDAGIKLGTSIRVDGNVVQELDIGWGFRLQLDVGDWMVNGTSASFNLTLRIAPPGCPLFFGPVTVTNQRLTLPLTAARSVASTSQSPADVYAMIQLAKLNADGPNQRQTTSRSPVVPAGQWQTRDHGPALLRVELGPCDDQGRVYINGELLVETGLNETATRIRELPDGIYNIRFELGNQGGWGYESNCSIFLNDELLGSAHDVGGTGFDAPQNVVKARHDWNFRVRDGQKLPDRDMVPTAASPRPPRNGHKPNGRSRLAEVLLRLMDEEEWEVKVPEAGGSIRA